ncbi:MAG: hypothetical protein AVDCRST_MAG49-4563, partial [uncultured Thermomicrobiales bacterium]
DRPPSSTCPSAPGPGAIPHHVVARPPRGRRPLAHRGTRHLRPRADRGGRGGYPARRRGPDRRCVPRPWAGQVQRPRNRRQPRPAARRQPRYRRQPPLRREPLDGGRGDGGRAATHRGRRGGDGRLRAPDRRPGVVDGPPVRLPGVPRRRDQRRLATEGDPGAV